MNAKPGFKEVKKIVPQPLHFIPDIPRSKVVIRECLNFGHSMFARLKKSGKNQYLQIVENRKVQGKVVQRVIGTLGTLS